MNRRVEVTADQNVVMVHVPMQLRKRGGRKLIIGELKTTGLSRPLVQSSEHRTIVKALGRAYRWKQMLEFRPVQFDHRSRSSRKHQPLIRSPHPAADAAVSRDH